MKSRIWLLLFLFLARCSDKNKYAGADIIPTQKMTTVLWDIMQVDEFATNFIVKDLTKNIKLERIKLYEEIFRLNHIKEKDFSASFKYYAAKPVTMKVIFDSLNARGERERRTMYVTDSSKAK